MALPVAVDGEVRFGPLWLRAALALALLFYPVCGIAGLPFGNGGRYASVLAGPLALLYLLAGFRHNWRELALEALRFVAPFGPFLAAGLLTLLVHVSAEVGDPFSRVLWTVPIVLAARRIGLTRTAVYSAAAVGALFYLGAALLDIYVQGLPRAGARVNPVIFAETASLCAGLAFIGALCERQTAVPIRAFWLLAGVAGIVAVAMSGSRGPLLATLWLVLLLGVTATRQGNRRAVALVVGAVGLVIAIAWSLLPSSGRMQLAVQEFEAYNGAAQVPLSSIGIRLELWRIALASWPDHWLFGYGYSTLEQLAPQLPALQVIPMELLQGLHHFHADWAHALMAGGIVLLAGLVATAAALLHQARLDAGRCWLVGAMVIFGLSDLAFFRKPTLTLFVASYGLLLAARDTRPHERAGPLRSAPPDARSRG
jgi:O-antigen ligase